MRDSSFIAAWIESGNHHSGIKSVRVVLEMMGNYLVELNDGNPISGIRLLHDQHKAKIVLSFVPTPAMRGKRWHFFLGSEKDGQRFLIIARKIINEYKKREEFRQKIKDVELRCSDPTGPLLIHDEFDCFLDLCSNINSRRIEIAKLEKDKSAAVDKLLGTFSVKTGLP